MMYPGPTFVMYAMNATYFGMRAVQAGLREDFSLDVEAFLKAMREEKPALVYIAYPNNPTGVLYAEEDVIAILKEATGLVVLDEAYHVFARKTFMSRLAEFPNLVVMRTVSKLGLAGIRLGYLAARPEWVEQFNKVRQVYNVNVLTQAAATFMLERLEVLEEQAARIRAEREKLGQAMKNLKGVTVFSVRGQLLSRPGAGRRPDVRGAQAPGRSGTQPEQCRAKELPARHGRHAG